MKIFKCVTYDDHEGALLTWHASRRKAEEYLKAETTDPRTGDDSITLYNIPRGKKALLKWLNIHHKTDNG